MGQKVNPYGFRLGVTTDWKSRWFTDREYTDYLVEDWKIRDLLMRELPHAAISRIEVERTAIACASTSTPPGRGSSSAAGGRRPTGSGTSWPSSPATPRS